MLKHLIIKLFFLCLMLICLDSLAQSHRPVSMALGIHANATVYDQYLPGNTGGAGLSARLFGRITSRIHAVAEANINVFGGNKVLVLDSNGDPLPSKSPFYTLMGGLTVQVREWLGVSLTAGVGGEEKLSKFAVRPAIYLYPGEKHRLVFHVSLTNVSQDSPGYPSDFGYLSFGALVSIF